MEVETWKPGIALQEGETCVMRLTERGKGKRKVVIKNGKIIEKPEDVDILGINTPFGFVIKGLKFKPNSLKREIHIEGCSWG